MKLRSDFISCPDLKVTPVSSLSKSKYLKLTLANNWNTSLSFNWFDTFLKCTHDFYFSQTDIYFPQEIFVEDPTSPPGKKQNKTKKQQFFDENERKEQNPNCFVLCKTKQSPQQRQQTCNKKGCVMLASCYSMKINIHFPLFKKQQRQRWKHFIFSGSGIVSQCR